MSFELAPLEDLEAKLTGLAQSVERKKFGKILSDTCRKIGELERDLQQAKDVASAIPLVVDDLVGVSREQVKERAAKIWGLGQQAAAASTQSQLDTLARDLGRITEWTRDLSRIALEAWQVRLRREFGPTQALGKVLKEIADTVDIGDLMTTAAASGLKLERALPRTEREREAFRQALEDRDSAYSLLSDMGGDKSVIHFLQAVAEGQANLGHVTAVVASWLEERGALTRFKVNL